ncbi:MAG: hypothetical protein ACFCUW_01265, partial [Kiloniellaceae bacterium]
MTGKRKTPRHLLSPEDRRLWQHVTAQAEPLAGRDRLHSRVADLLPDEPAPASGPLRRAAAPGPRRALA